MNAEDKQLLCADKEIYLEQAMNKPIINASGRGDHILETENMIWTIKDGVRLINAGVCCFMKFPKLMIIENAYGRGMATTPLYTIMTGKVSDLKQDLLAHMRHLYWIWEYVLTLYMLWQHPKPTISFLIKINPTLFMIPILILWISQERDNKNNNNNNSNNPRSRP